MQYDNIKQTLFVQEFISINSKNTKPPCSVVSYNSLVSGCRKIERNLLKICKEICKENQFEFMKYQNTCYLQFHTCKILSEFKNRGSVFKPDMQIK